MGEDLQLLAGSRAPRPPPIPLWVQGAVGRPADPRCCRWCCLKTKGGLADNNSASLLFCLVLQFLDWWYTSAEPEIQRRVCYACCSIHACHFRLDCRTVACCKEGGPKTCPQSRRGLISCLCCRSQKLPPPPPPPAPAPAPGGVALPSDRSACPLCRQPITNPALLAVSGYCFCYPCVFRYIQQHGRCPVTMAPAKEEHLRSLYDTS